MRVAFCPAWVHGIGRPSEPHSEAGRGASTTSQRVFSIVQSKQYHIYFFGLALWVTPATSCSDVWVSGHQRELNFAVLEPDRPRDRIRDLTQSPAISLAS